MFRQFFFFFYKAKRVLTNTMTSGVNEELFYFICPSSVLFLILLRTFFRTFLKVFLSRHLFYSTFFKHKFVIVFIRPFYSFLSLKHNMFLSLFAHHHSFYSFSVLIYFHIHPHFTLHFPSFFSFIFLSHCLMVSIQYKPFPIYTVLNSNFSSFFPISSFALKLSVQAKALLQIRNDLCLTKQKKKGKQQV